MQVLPDKKNISLAIHLQVKGKGLLFVLQPFVQEAKSTVKNQRNVSHVLLESSNLMMTDLVLVLIAPKATQQMERAKLLRLTATYVSTTNWPSHTCSCP